MERNLFNGEFLQKISLLRMKMEQHSLSPFSGLRKSSAKGSSVEFSDFREYIPGEDIRRIDWNVYARMDKLYIKLFQEEREGMFHIFLDQTASMDYGEKKKSDCALFLAATFAYLILNGGDRAELLTWGGKRRTNDKIRALKNLSGSKAFSHVLEFLNNWEPDGTVNLMEEVKKQKISNYGTSILISDFFNREEIEGVVKYLRLYKKQQVLLVQVLSREELEPSLFGSWKLLDAENTSETRITISPSVLKAYQSTLEKFLKEIKRIGKRYQCSYYGMITDEPLERLLKEGMNREWESK